MIKEYREILELFKELSDNTDKNMDIYLIGGGALMKHGLKEYTKDVDIVVGDEETFNGLTQLLLDVGFISKMPEEAHLKMSLSQILVRGEARVDLFNRTVCRTLFLSEGMKGRSRPEETGGVRLHVCAPEDLLIFKSVSEREGDREDSAQIVRSGKMDWNTVMSEIKHQMENGEDVRITWITAFFNELAEEKKIITPMQKELNALSDAFFEKYEGEHANHIKERNC
ncbi:MAG: nucleotidyltransferase [Methanomassiliicoccaceae archaeon]|nr:nucleotidyltransferase [Methanomassiliicoccaceae archaeon]